MRPRSTSCSCMYTPTRGSRYITDFQGTLLSWADGQLYMSERVLIVGSVISQVSGLRITEITIYGCRQFDVKHWVPKKNNLFDAFLFSDFSEILSRVSISQAFMLTFQSLVNWFWRHWIQPGPSQWRQWGNKIAENVNAETYFLSASTALQVIAKWSLSDARP